MEPRPWHVTGHPPLLMLRVFSYWVHVAAPEHLVGDVCAMCAERWDGGPRVLPMPDN